MFQMVSVHSIGSTLTTKRMNKYEVLNPKYQEYGEWVNCCIRNVDCLITFIFDAEYRGSHYLIRKRGGRLVMCNSHRLMS